MINYFVSIIYNFSTQWVLPCEFNWRRSGLSKPLPSRRLLRQVGSKATGLSSSRRSSSSNNNNDDEEEKEDEEEDNSSSRSSSRTTTNNNSITSSGNSSSSTTTTKTRRIAVGNDSVKFVTLSTSLGWTAVGPYQSEFLFAVT